MKIWLTLIFFAISLGGCNLAHTLATGGAAGTGSLVCGSIGGPLIGAGCATAATVAVEVLAPAVNDKVTLETIGGTDGLNSFGEFLTYGYVKFWEHFITIGVVGGLIWFLTGYFGLRMRRPEEKQLEKQISMLVDKIGKMKE